MRRAHILDSQINDGPAVAGFIHIIVGVANILKQLTARDFEILRVSTVPDDLHRVQIVERDLDCRFGADRYFYHAYLGSEYPDT